MTTTTSYRILNDLTTDEYYALLADLRDAVKADDGGRSAIRYVQSDFDPHRYNVVAHGVSIGWVVNDGKWYGYVARRGEALGRLVAETSTRKGATAEIIMRARR